MGAPVLATMLLRVAPSAGLLGITAFVLGRLIMMLKAGVLRVIGQVGGCVIDRWGRSGQQYHGRVEMGLG